MQTRIRRNASSPIANHGRPNAPCPHARRPAAWQSRAIAAGAEITHSYVDAAAVSYHVLLDLNEHVLLFQVASPGMGALPGPAKRAAPMLLPWVAPQ